MMSTRTGISIKNILLPTDFSDESAHAINYVCGLQRHYDASVYVVHVLDAFPFSLSSDLAAAARITEIQQRGSKQMQDFIEAHRLEGIKFNSTLLSGEISSAVEKFSRERAIDLIVLGSHGDEGVTRLFRGSMAEEIFRTAECPVMVVGPKASARESRGVFDHLLFPTDLSSFSKAAIPYVELLLINDRTSRVSLAPYLEQDPRTPYERHRLRELIEQELTAMISPALRQQIEGVAVEFCSPAEGIIDMARGLDADLLVLGVRHGGSFVRAATHGLCSMAAHVIAQAPCPVLTVRAL
jgi:nucleotide-binding universal stress UspA family protein